MEHGQHGHFPANAPDLINCPNQSRSLFKCTAKPPSSPFRRSQFRRPGRGCATVSSDFDASVNVSSRVGTALAFASHPANNPSRLLFGRKPGDAVSPPFRFPGLIRDAAAAAFLSRFDKIASAFRSVVVSDSRAELVISSGK